jgi:ribonuclease P/MRP protein subunit RPP25
MIFDYYQADGARTIVIKAMGRAINKAVTIAEILKRKMPLHQLNVLSSVEMIDVYEPMEEGLDTVESHRYVSCMKITLSLSVDDLDASHPGYQPPLSAEDMNQADPAATASPPPPPATTAPPRPTTVRELPPCSPPQRLAFDVSQEGSA